MRLRNGQPVKFVKPGRRAMLEFETSLWEPDSVNDEMGHPSYIIRIAAK